jgi:branched-chain amino acid transport system substrate-binding protein
MRIASRFGVLFCSGLVALLLACAPAAPQPQAGAPAGKAAAPSAAKEPDVYKLGGSFPMTGAGSTFGTFFTEGSTLGIEEINAAGGVKGKKLELIIEDNKVEPPTGVAIYRKLVEVDKVPLVLITFTNVGLAQLPVADETKTVAYTAAMVLPGLSEKSEWVFRSTVGADLESIGMARYIYNERGLRKIGIIHQTQDAALAGAQEFRKEFTRLGGQVVVEESYEIGAVDVRPQLLKVRGANPDGIYQVGRDATMGLLLKQAVEIGFKVPQFANASIELPDAVKAAGEALEGTVYTIGALDPDTSKDFVAKYKQRWAKDPEVWAGNHYDAVKMIAKAIETDGYTAEGIRKGLMAIKDFPGVTGKTSFDGKREAAKTVIMMTFKDGKPSFVKSVS